MKKTRFFGALLGAGLLLASTPALANGRFPTSQLVLTDPSDPNRLWVRATHGVLTSTDRGCTWNWICEAALGYRGTEDPMLGVMADGTVIGGIFDGLVTSRDRGCEWSLLGPMQNLNVVDLSVEKNDPTRAVAVSSNGDSSGRFVNRVWRTTDSARSWTQVGQDLASNILPITIDVAPSDPRRLYMTGYQYVSDAGFVTKNVLLRSDDAGESWTTLDMFSSTVEPYLSAIHPTQPDKIYVRLRTPDDPNLSVVNRVVYSGDGGGSWQELFLGNADILGFALSPDGSRVAIGLGDSRAPAGARPVDRNVLGIYAASTVDHQFVRRREGHVGCMTWTPQGIYFCGDGFLREGLPAFELGLTQDEGATVTQVMELAGVEGPLACPAESQTSRVCELQGDWPGICKTIGRCDFETGEPTQLPRGETCPPGSAGSAGAAGASGGGQGGTSAPLDNPDGGGRPGAAPENLHIDDGCSISGTERSRDVALFALAALAVLGGLHGARRYARRGR